MYNVIDVGFLRRFKVFATESVTKFVETFDFHIEYVFWLDLRICQV